MMTSESYYTAIVLIGLLIDIPNASLEVQKWAIIFKCINIVEFNRLTNNNNLIITIQY
jgi:hypothetical protein